MGELVPVADLLRRPNALGVDSMTFPSLLCKPTVASEAVPNSLHLSSGTQSILRLRTLSLGQSPFTLRRVATSVLYLNASDCSVSVDWTVCCSTSRVPGGPVLMDLVVAESAVEAKRSDLLLSGGGSLLMPKKLSRRSRVLAGA